MGSLRVAVEGCGHGTLHAIYASIERSCKEKGWPGVDLLVICGDFQAVRNAYDLNCVAMPAKYREMCDFHEYYAGQRKAPYLTIFVGGNHEASNYLFELYYGGWVAENIYYMGAANVLQFGPLRIAGMSGIWKGYNYNKPHHERLPYNEDDIKSIYHVRDIDARKLLQITSKIDIGISHDWPRGVEWMGDWKDLFRKKDHLEPDARSGQLGNVAAKNVLDKLKPDLWFSAHLHCKYAAVVDHNSTDQRSAATALPQVDNGNDDRQTVKPATAQLNDDELDLDLDDEAEEQTTIDVLADNHKPESNLVLPESTTEGLGNGHTEVSITKFLALDKCLANRHFLQLLDIPSQTDLHRPIELSYDKEWLAITRAFALSEALVLGESKFNAPKAKTTEQYRNLIDQQLKWVDTLPEAKLAVPHNFSTTAPVYDGGNIRDPRYSQAAGGLKEYTNPQTAQFCELLQIPNAFDMPEEERAERMDNGPRPSSTPFGGHGNSHRGGRGGRGHRGSYRGSRRGGNR